MPKLSQLPAIVGVVKGTDILHHVDPLAGVPVSSGLTVDELKTYMGGGGGGSVDGFVYGVAQQNVSVPIGSPAPGGNSYKVVAAGGLDRGVPPDLVNGGFVVPVTGLYKVEFSIEIYITAFSGNNAVLEFSLFHNLIAYPIVDIHVFSQSRKVSGMGSIVLSMGAGKIITMQMGSSVSTMTSINLNEVMFRVEQLA